MTEKKLPGVVMIELTPETTIEEWEKYLSHIVKRANLQEIAEDLQLSPMPNWVKESLEKSEQAEWDHFVAATFLEARSALRASESERLYDPDKLLADLMIATPNKGEESSGL